MIPQAWIEPFSGERLPLAKAGTWGRHRRGAGDVDGNTWPMRTGKPELWRSRYEVILWAVGAGNLMLLKHLYIVSQGGDMSSSYVMNIWTRKVQESHTDQTQIEKLQYLGWYGGIQLACAGFTFLRLIVLSQLNYRSAARSTRGTVGAATRANGHFDTTIKAASRIDSATTYKRWTWSYAATWELFGQCGVNGL